MRGRTIDPVRQRRIESMSRAGMTVAAIARDLGVCTQTVVNARKRAGLTTHRPKRAFTPIDRVRIAGMLADGMSYAEIGRTVGWSHQSIQRAFPGRGWTVEQRNEHVRLLRQLHPDYHEWGRKLATVLGKRHPADCTHQPEQGEDNR